MSSPTPSTLPGAGGIAWWRSAPAAHRLRVLGALLFVVVAVIAGRKLLGKVTDFDVVTDAVARWRAGGDIYEVQPGRLAQYWYPAWILLPVAWAEDLFGSTGMRILATLLCAWSTVSMARDLGRIANLSGLVVRPLHVVLFVAIFGRCFSNNFTNGQLSIVIGALLTHAVYAVLIRAPMRAGLALGCATAMKVTPALLIVVLPLLGQVGVAGFAALTTAALVFVVPWPVVGTALHSEWLVGFWELVTGSLRGSAGGPEMQVHLQQARSASVLGTLDHVLKAAEPVGDRQAGFYWVDVGAFARRSIIVLWSVILVGVSVLGIRAARRDGAAPVDPSEFEVGARRALAIQLAILLLLTSLLSPQSKPYHFLHHAWSMWLFVLLWSHRRGFPWRSIGWWSVAAMFLLAMPLRQKSVLGVWLWRTLDECGLLHLALVGQLVVLALAAKWLRSRE